jgi:Ca2+-binding RTX toxin-like protein
MRILDMATIIGTAANDVLYGGFEDDFIDGGAGEDGMIGGFGNDTYILREPGDEILEFKRQGFDTAVVYFDYSLPEHVDNLDLAGGFIGSGNRLSNLIQGNNANNILTGRGGSDLIYGFEEVDIIRGGNGNDRLYGGGGNDTLIAGKGYDEMYGGPGNDTYIVRSYDFRIIERQGRSRDTIKIPLNYELEGTRIENLNLLRKARFGTGSQDNNTIIGNRIANILSGLKGNDRIYGRGGSDILYGNEGNDIVGGDDGSDQLYGQDGNDRLYGDGGNDLLVGEAGRDTLTGYGGGRRERDRLEGGTSADVFVLGVVGKGGAFYRGSGFATIVDFKRSEKDKVQVNGSKLKRTYSLVTNRNFSGSSARDTAIFRGRDLLAVVEDTTNFGFRDLVAVDSASRSPI